MNVRLTPHRHWLMFAVPCLFLLSAASCTSRSDEDDDERPTSIFGDDDTTPNPGSAPGTALCPAGEMTCADPISLLLCADDGQAWEEIGCAEQEVCRDGACHPAGPNTTTNNDNNTSAMEIERCVEVCDGITGCLDEDDACAESELEYVYEDCAMSCGGDLKSQILTFGEQVSSCEEAKSFTREVFPHCTGAAPNRVDGSYIARYAFEYDASRGADLDGDGVPNNALGELLERLDMLTGLDSVYNSTIDTGELSLGGQWRLSGDFDNATDVEFDVMLLDHAPPGSASEYVVADLPSFLGHSDYYVMGPGEIVNNELYLSGGRMLLEFEMVARFLAQVDLPVLQGESIETPSGMEFGGSLFGVLQQEFIVEGINTFASGPDCACIEGDGQLLQSGQGLNVLLCNPDLNAGACAADDRCRQIVDVCPELVSLISDLSDIDIDGDGAPEGLSFAVSLNMQGAPIGGLEP